MFVVKPLRSLLPQTLHLRHLHVDASLGRQEISQWFQPDIISAESHPPDRINAFTNLISTNSPRTVNRFSYTCVTRDRRDKWRIQGLRISEDRRQRGKRSVIIASGLRAVERGTINVNLYIAAALSRVPLPGVDVMIIPLENPRDYEAQWKADQMLGRSPSTPFATKAHDAIFPQLQRDNKTDASSVIAKAIAMRTHGNNYIAAEVNLNQALSVYKYKERVLPVAADPLSPLTFGNPLPIHAPPAILIEIRNRDSVLGEEHIVPRGQEIIALVKQLVEETSGM